MEKKRWTSAIDAGLPPSRIREVLFDLAATMDRHEAVTDASRRLGINPSMTERWLFSDRERHRRLEPPPEAASPSLLRAQYNLALAHSLLLRCAEMRATVRGSARALVRYTKASGLMAMFSVSGEDE